MPRTLNLDFRGLYTYPNPFSKVPVGALKVADNVNIDRQGMLTTRRGYGRYGDSFGAVRILSELAYQNRLIVHTSDSVLSYDSDGAGTWVPYSGTYDVPDSSDPSSRIRSVGSNKNIYMTTEEGIVRLDAIDGTPVEAGVPRGLGGSGAVTGVTGFMANDTNVAYRIVWAIIDANDNLHLSAPSDRIVVTNTSGGTRNVDLTFLIPAEITTAYSYQVYRSAASATANDEPNDEMQLVYEANPTAGEITAGEVTITDNTPDDLRRTTLYTNPETGEGIAEANDQPPFAKDIALFKGHVFYANTRTPHRKTITLVAVDAPTGIQVGDTITVTRTGGSPTFTITGAAVEDAAAGEFLVYTAGTPAQNIEVTARSIVSVINIYASNTFVNAYYSSGFDELPGEIFLEDQTLTPTSFYINCSRADVFDPPIPTSGSNVNNTSVNEESPNRIYISKLQNPEAVPLLSYEDVGSADQPIVRIIPLRDSLMILKTDGVFRLSGSTRADFTIYQLDPSTSIVAPNSAAVLSNRVFWFCEQGIVAASDNGLQIVSYPIEGTLLEISSPLNTNFDDYTFGLGYESDRKYILATISGSGDNVATQMFVYNEATDSWTRWVREFTCGIVNPADNKLYFGTNSATDAYVRQERKTFPVGINTDFADESFPVVITGSSGTTVTLTDTSDCEVGMALLQDVTVANITEVVNPTTIIVDVALLWMAGDAAVYTPIDVVAETTVLDAKEPTTLKHFREASLLFAGSQFESLDMTFRTDVTQEEDTVTITPEGSGPWGLFPWGEIPWGGTFGPAQRVRTYVPRQMQRCNWMTVEISLSQAFTTFALNGIALVYEWMSPNMR